MDIPTQILLFVNEFCNQIDRVEKNRRKMCSWYMWGDKRDGSITDRFNLDASDFMEYRRMFQP